MTDDIVERLRHATNYGSPNTTQLLTEAADEIKRLQVLEAELYAVLSERNVQADEIKRLRTQCGGNCRYWEGRWRDEAKENELLLAVIEKLNTEIERQRAERDVWKIACNAQADEVKRLRAGTRVIPGTNIPDAGTSSY